MKKKIFIIGIGTFGMLFILSILFFKERTIFTDAAFHLFYLVNEGKFQVQHHRFVAIFTQIFPISGIKLHLSLATIAQLYSTSFILLYTLCFLVLYKWIKNERLAIAYLLFNILITTHSFYWMLSEMLQGIVFLFLSFAVLENRLISKTTNKFDFPLLSICTFIFAFSHPLIIFPFAFLLLFFMLQYPNKKLFLYYYCLPFIFIYLIKSQFINAEYDNNAMKGIQNFIILFPNYFNIQSNINFFHYLFKDYYFLIILFILNIYVYIKTDKKLKLILLLGFSIGFLFLVNVSYQSGGEQFYMESQYLLLALFLVIPFVYDYLPILSNEKLKQVTIAVICLVGIIRIYNNHYNYSARLIWNKQFISKTENLPNKKLIVSSKKVPSKKLMMTWASSYEFLLLSAMENQISRSIIIVDNENELDWALANNHCFIAKWGIFDYAELNSRYFRIEDTTFYKKY